MIGHPPTERVVLALQRALGARDPLAALQALTELRAELDAYEFARVREALASGASFGQVGRALGISRQAAHRRYRERTPARPRTMISDGVRAVLGAARQEAARAGAAEVECEHVALALAARDARPVDLEAARVLVAGPSSGPLPMRIGRRLRALLTSEGAPVDVDALRRVLSEDPVASRILDRLQA